TPAAAAAGGRRPARLWGGRAAGMLQRGPPAASCLLNCGASACTDVTGFGLLGHLLEMLRASGVDGILDPETIPALEGALPLLARGITSSLHSENISAFSILDPGAQAHELAPLLIDPQT